MLGYKRPCRYCDNLIPSASEFCPLCKKVNPLGQLRCTVCRNPIQEGWITCPGCGTSLEVECPNCGKLTFLADYCKHCESRLVLICPNKKCNFEQPVTGVACVKCKTKLK